LPPTTPDQPAAELVNATDRPFLVWCNLNEESKQLTKAIPGAVEVKGSDSPEYKEKSLTDFADGKIRALVSKSTIAGFGMNFQVCSDMVFVGLNDSWESYYQTIRRSWRFGQTREVNVHVIAARTEGAVVQNIKRKEKDAENMSQKMIEHMKDLNAEALRGATARNRMEYTPELKIQLPGWLVSV
jgi:hypothetical protein